jgi:hypothetical protein
MTWPANLIDDPHPERLAAGDSFWTWDGTRVYGAQPRGVTWWLLNLGGFSRARGAKTTLVRWLWRDGSRRSQAGSRLRP